MTEQKTLVQVYTDEATYYRHTGQTYANIASRVGTPLNEKAANAAEAAKYFNIATRFETLLEAELKRIADEQDATSSALAYEDYDNPDFPNPEN